MRTLETSIQLISSDNTSLICTWEANRNLHTCSLVGHGKHIREQLKVQDLLLTQIWHWHLLMRARTHSGEPEANANTRGGSPSLSRTSTFASLYSKIASTSSTLPRLQAKWRAVWPSAFCASRRELNELPLCPAVVLASNSLHWTHRVNRIRGTKKNILMPESKYLKWGKMRGIKTTK